MIYLEKVNNGWANKIIYDIAMSRNLLGNEVNVITPSEFRKTLPYIGYIVYDSSPEDRFNYTSIAMGFLRNVEGPYAIIESLATNTDYPSREERYLALKRIIKILLSEAKEMDKKEVWFFSSNRTVIQGAIKEFGFEIAVGGMGRKTL